MLPVYASATIFILASTVVGQVVYALATGRATWSWSAPALGFATLIVVCSLSLGLPGRARAGEVLLAILLIACLIWLARKPRPGWSPWPVVITVAALSLASIPFLVHGRVGILGAGEFDNDASVHLLWVEGLRSARIEHLFPTASGYPLGPHVLMAALAQATGFATDDVFTGLTIAVAAMTALAAAGFLRMLPPILAALGGLMSAFAYLAVEYFAQSSYKELIMALLLVAFVLIFRDLLTLPAARWARTTAALGLVVGAGVLTFGPAGIAWFVAFLVAWAGVELIVARPSDVKAAARRAAVPALSGAVVLLVVVATNLNRIVDFFSAKFYRGTGSGNVPHAISPFEALGIWPSADFRLDPTGIAFQTELHALALAAVLFGAFWWILRGESTIVAGVIGGWIVWIISSAGRPEYALAKALAIMAPLIMLMAVGALFDALVRAWPGSGRRVMRFALVAVLTVAFVTAAGWSSLIGLRGAPVAGTAQADELADLRATIGHAPTLYLGNDDFASWQLRGVPVGYYSTTGPRPPIPVTLRSGAPYVYGQPLDFDSVSPRTLDEFTYVITPRSGYQSATPTNFRLVRTTRLFDLWRREGETPFRRVIDANGEPGGILDCRKPAARALSRLPGWASVRPAPIVFNDFPVMQPGLQYQASEINLPLPRGNWQLSVQYTSAVPVHFQLGTTSETLPANTGRPGPFFAAGTIRQPAPGDVRVRIAQDLSFLSTGNDRTFIGSLAATRTVPPHRVPLKEACGRYVDWYVLT